MSKGHWSDSYSTRLDDNSPRNVINFHGRSTTNGGGVSSTGAVPTGEWVHVAVTFDVSALGDDTSFYINGVLDSTADYGSALSLNDYALRIGNSISGSWSYWNGMIDDVQIYNTALNAGQIQTVMAGNIIPEPSTIVLAASGLLCLGLFARRRRT